MEPSESARPLRARGMPAAGVVVYVLHSVPGTHGGAYLEEPCMWGRYGH